MVKKTGVRSQKSGVRIQDSEGCGNKQVRKSGIRGQTVIARVVLVLFLLLTSDSWLLTPAFPQQPQAQAGQEIFPVNAKFVQGFGPGYWPTAGANLTLNLAPGTAVCSNVVRTYAGGTLTLAPSATNYVYLNTSNNCAPASNTTGFTAATIPIATVITTSTAISSITDVRTMFVSSGATSSGSVTSVGMTGDGIIFSPTVPGSPITSTGTLAPQLLTQTANTVLAGPGSGPAATPTFRALAPADLPATISSNTTGNAATATALASSPTQCSSNNWTTGISTTGNATCSQPGFSNLAGSLGLAQTPLTTAGDLLFTNSTPALARLPLGGANQFLGISGGLPAWIQPTFSNLSGTATISQGGTGQTTAAAAFNALSPLTTEGDLHYYHSSSNTRLAIGGANTFLTSDGTDPSWGSLTGAGFGSQTANNFLAAPNGSSGNPSFRAIVASDLPTIAISGGGTGQTTANAGFNALSPLTTEGDLLYYHSSANARLARGSNGQCLTSNGTDPVWGSCSTGSGTVTSVGLSMPSLFSVSGSPVTGSGTLTAGLANQNANLIMAGPGSGNAAAPTFRALVGADLPAPTASTLGGVESVTCTTGQFLDQISTGGVPACATPSGGGSSTGLGNGSTVIDASLQAGADFGSKVNAAIQLCPSTGCVVDARGLSGSQTLAGNVSLGSASQPITLLLANGLYLTRASGAQILLGESSKIEGPAGFNAAYIVGNDSVAAIKQAPSSAYSMTVEGVRIQNTGTGPCVDFSTGVDSALIQRNVFACATGLTYAGYYGRIENNIFFGNKWAGIVMDASEGVNSNELKDNTYSGQTGTGVFLRGGYANTLEGKEDLENLGLGYFVDATATTIHDPYFENVQPTASWTASTLYGLGAILKDSNGNGEICVTAGTSGSSAPSWSITQGGSTSDGGITWMMFNPDLVSIGPGYPAGPGILIAPGAAKNSISGGFGAAVLDLDAVVSGDFSNQISTVGNNAWGPAGQALYSVTAQPYLGFQFGFWNGNANPLASFNFNTGYVGGWDGYGGELDSEGNNCSTYGYCGHIPLHVATIVPSTGIVDYGPVIINALPTPAAPTLSVVGTAGSTTVSYYNVAHCGGGVTLPSAAATITNAPGTLNGSNYLQVQVPSTYTGFNGWPDQWSMCTWDILKGDTSHSLTTGAYLGNGIYNDQGGATSPYTAPTQNTTGTLYVGNPGLGYGSALGLNQMLMQQEPNIPFSLPGVSIHPNPALANSEFSFLKAPSGTGSRVIDWSCFNSDMAAAHCYASVVTSSGALLGSYGANLPIQTMVSGNTSNTLEDGSGNMAAANKMTAQQFCVGSNCVTSLWSNPLTTLGDLLYGGASGAATRLAGNASTTPMYLKSVGSGSAAGAPTLAQIQFSDIAGTVGISAGGTGRTSFSAGLLRSSGSSLSSAELSGDCTTSGSNAVTCTKTNGASFAPSATTDTTNAANITSGVFTAAREPNTTVNSISNDTNVTGSIAAQNLTLGWTGQLSIARGGTGQSTAATAFNALSPLSTEGDLNYYHSSSNTRLAVGGANTFLTSNGTDPSWGSLTGAGFGSQTANTILAAPNGSSGNPSFRTLVAADLPASITSSTSGNAATATALASTPTQCTAGKSYALGIAASGNANCQAIGFSSRAVSGSTDTILSSDLNGSVNYTGSSSITVTLPTATTLGISNFFTELTNATSGSSTAVTVNATSWQIYLNGSSSGSSSLVISQGQPCFLSVDPAGGAWDAFCHESQLTSGSGITASRTASGLTLGLASGWNPVSIANGGTGQTTAAAGFNALSPLTTEGDLHYYHSSSNTRLVIGAANTFLSSNGTDPSWGSLTGAGFGSQSAYSWFGNASASAGNPSFNTSALPASLMPSPTASTLGGIESITAASHKWINSISTSGVPNQTQPADTDLTGTTAGALPYVSSGALAELATTAYGVLAAGATNPTWVAPSATSGVPLISKGSSTTPAYGTAVVAGGGTGQTSLTAYDLLIGNGTSAVTLLAPSATSGVPLVSQGSSSNPAYGTAVVGGGGTGQTSLTAHDLLIGNGTSAVTLLAPSSTSGVPLVSQGSSSNPAYGTVAIAGGGTGQTTASAAFNALSPLTTEGDLPYYHSSSNTRLGVGTNGQCLTSNGTDPLWGACGGGSGTVTSIGAGTGLSSSGSNPITSSGTLSVDCDPMNMTTVCLHEEFAPTSGPTTSNIGSLGWNLVQIGGTASAAVSAGSSWPHLGVISFHTPATSGQGANLSLSTNGAYGLGELGGNCCWTSYFEFSFGTASGAVYRIGYGDTGQGTAIPQYGGWYLRFDPSLATPDTTLHLCNNLSGTETCQDTGLSPDTNWHKLAIRSVAAAKIGITLDAGTEVTVCSSGCTITATPYNNPIVEPFFQAVSNTSSTMEWLYADFWRFKATGLSF